MYSFYLKNNRLFYVIRLLLFFSAIFLGKDSFSQFQLNGNASSLGSNTYQLTPASNWQFGAIWYQVQQNIDNPFSVQGQMYLGTLSGGADGIVFVMQNKCLINGAGAAGGNIGYGGMSGQSIAVEFDTFINNSGSTPNNSDPAYDHIAIESNGNVDHANAANTLAGPIQMDLVKTSVKDGIWYDFQINYDPSTTTITVYFNGSLRLSLVYDIKSNIFGGNPYVYWGFVSATGGSFNDQEVKINSSTTYAISDVTMCAGSSVQKHLPPLGGPNIASGKNAVASSLEGAGYAASNVTDGNLGTRWSSQPSDPQWIYVDLVNPSDIDSVVLFWENASANQYKIQTSTDAVTWIDQYTVINGPAGANMMKMVFTATNVRYVRMYGTVRNTGYGYSLFEFRVLGKQKYQWSPNDGSINDIYSSDPIFSPSVTTTYSVTIPDACLGSVSYSFTITVNCTMPIGISEFIATGGEKVVHLSWTTISEHDSKGFEILRSNDGFQFSKIGFVDAFGNSNSNKYYEFDDDQFSSEDLYYQLNLEDIDGNSQKSPIIFVSRSTFDKPFVLQPTFEDETLVKLPGKLEYVEFKIVDFSGREIYSWGDETPSHFESIGRNLKSGSYILIIKSDRYNESIPINKVK
jgi:hypothetical protein